MTRTVFTRALCRAPGIILVVAALLCVVAPAALAVDGVPLYPHGIDAAYSQCSMEHPDLSGPMLAFELYGLSSPPVVKDSHARIYGWNTANGTNWALGNEVPGLPAAADQRHPTVLDTVAEQHQGRDVYVAWAQLNDPGTASWDIWLWRGSENGVADAGFPMLLVSGPTYTNQVTPELGLTTVAGSKHIILTWADDRDTLSAPTEVYMLDLSLQSDADTVPDYLEASFDPATAGTRVDPSGSLLKGQRDPVVGSKGIFWLDYRNDGGTNQSDVYRANLAGVAPVVTSFWHNTFGPGAVSPRATSLGVSWLGPGIAGGPFEPWMKNVGGGAGIPTSLSAPGALDAVGNRFAVTGGHGGNTSGDWDIYFYDRATRQNVPVCSVGDPNGAKLKTQDMPTIGTAPGGSRVIWSDARQSSNTAVTDWNALAYELYVALVPTVSENASRTTILLGQSLTLGTKVKPDFRGYTVKFQKGVRKSFAHPWYLGGKLVEYFNWTTLKTRTLGPTSRTTWSWTPTHKGTYWVRAWFVGGSKYVDVQSAHRKVPHVPNASRIIKIVVK